MGKGDNMESAKFLPNWELQSIIFSCLALGMVGCASTAADHSSIVPLPEKGNPKPFSELLTRMKSQASVATDCYYTNDWDNLQIAAKSMAQTASYLGKATEVPVSSQASISKISPEMEMESDQLLQAAKNRDEKAVNVSLQKIHSLIRRLRINN
jgi:hypothetical protein